MWLRSEVTDQSHLRLTAKIFTQLSEANGKQSHSKSNAESTNLKRRKAKTSSCAKHKSTKFTETQKPETSSQLQFSADTHSDSNQFSVSSSVRNGKYNRKKRVLRKPYNNGEESPCSKSSRILEKIKGRAARRIGSIALKQSIVRSRKLNVMENNSQLTRILHKTARWHRRNENMLKDSFYENGGIFNKKNFEKAPNCSKKHKGPTEDILQDKTSYKKISRGLLKSIQKRTGFSDETAKINKNIGGVSKLQRKSSFRLSNSKQKCNIKCCDKKCLSKNIDNCTNAMERLDLVNEGCLNGKSNVIVMSQYVNPSLQLSSVNEKITGKAHELNLSGGEVKNSQCPVEKTTGGGVEKKFAEGKGSQEKDSYNLSPVFDSSPIEKLVRDANITEEIRLNSFESSCKTMVAGLHGK